MKNLIMIIFVLLLPVMKTNGQVFQEWVQRYNGPDSLTDIANAIDLDGNIYVAGYIENGISGADYLTVKYNSTGGQLWVRTYNGTGNGYDAAGSVATDGSGNVYVSGVSEGSGTLNDIVTVKYDAAGNEIWVARFDWNNSTQMGSAVAVDGAGNVYITGSSENAGNSFDYLTVKYNNSGVVQWTKFYDGPAHLEDRANALALDDAGNIYVTGFSTGVGTKLDFATIKYNSAGDELWAARHNDGVDSNDVAHAIAVDMNGNVYVTGTNFTLITTGHDYATIKYNSSGVEQWIAHYNGPGNGRDIATSMAVDKNANVYVTGLSAGATGSFDYATVKYNTNGILKWAQRYNGPADGIDIAFAIAQDKNSNVYVTGTSAGNGTVTDYATIKYTSQGALEWIQRYNGPSNGAERANAIAVDSSMNVYVTGMSEGSGSGLDIATVKYGVLSTYPFKLNSNTFCGNNDFSINNEKWFIFKPDTSSIKIELFKPSINGHNESHLKSLSLYEIVDSNLYNLQDVTTGHGSDTLPAIQDTGFIVGHPYILRVTEYDQDSCQVCKSNNRFFDLCIKNYPIYPLSHACTDGCSINFICNWDFETNQNCPPNNCFTSGHNCVFTPPLPNPIPSLGATGNIITIGRNAQNYSGSWTGTNNTPGGQYFLICDVSATLNTPIWQQTVSVLPNTQYEFSFWAQNLIRSNINNAAGFTDPNITAFVNSAALSFKIQTIRKGIGWVHICYNWYSGNNTSATFVIQTQNAGGLGNAGNDIGIDDIVLRHLAVQNADAGPDIFICPSNNNGTVTIGTPLQTGFTYNWSPSTGLGDETNIAQPHVTIPITHPGDFSTSITYTLSVTDADGCISYDDVVVTLLQNPPQVALSSSGSSCSTQQTIAAYVVSTGSDPSISYLWVPGNFTTPSINVNVTSPTNYSVTVSNTCFSNTASITVEPCEQLYGSFPPLLYPSAFTPNGDNLDEEWVVYHQANPIITNPAYNATQYQLSIFNRWGGEIYNKIEYAQPCDGFFNGQIQWNGRANITLHYNCNFWQWLAGNCKPDYDAGQIVQEGLYIVNLYLKNCDHPNWVKVINNFDIYVVK